MAAPAPCTLLSPFGLWMQAALGVVTFSSLIAKRHFEVPRRAWLVFFMDSAKQACSAGTAHLVGMGLALALGSLDPSIPECGWYFLCFVINIAVSVPTTLALLGAARRCGARHGLRVCDAGDYGQGRAGDGDAAGGDGNAAAARPSCGLWAAQLAVWVALSLPGQAAVAALVYLARAPLATVAGAISRPFRDKPNVFLVLVMVVGPLCLNIMQLWLQDQKLKRKVARVGADKDRAPSASVSGRGRRASYESDESAASAPLLTPTAGV
jgi:hypothetical protein